MSTMTSDPTPLPPAPAPASQPVVALVRDLMFSSRITATGKAAGVAIKVVRDPARLGIEPAARLIVDLNLPGAIDAVAQWLASPISGGAVVVGFVAHTDAPTSAAARAAGITHVMARSRFVEVLPRIVAGQTW